MTTVAVADVLHANEVPVDDIVVRRLLGEQFPEWATLPLERVATPGSDHVLYRLGRDLVVRLPRKEGVDPQIDKERTWLPRLAPLVSCALPTPVAKGTPSRMYPFAWSVYTWLDGDNPPEGIAASELARDLARFVTTLQSVDIPGGPAPGSENFGRGEPLARRDAATRAAIAQLASELDPRAVTAAWEHALGTPVWEGRPVWLHGDLTTENILVRHGRLAAVLDFGCLGVGDPACDLMVAWSLMTPEDRKVFRAEVGADEETWARGRGWALSTALIALPYYGETHRPRAANARYRIAEILGELNAEAR
jgi:aminoglycoside phosphotransferase (APT) family kinase protein